MAIIRSMTTKQSSLKGIFASNLRGMLDEPSPYEGGLSYTEAICKKLLRLAADPDKENYYAIELVMNRVDGRPSQNVTVEQAVSVLLELDDMQLSKALGMPLRELQNRRRQLAITGISDSDIDTEGDNGTSSG